MSERRLNHAAVRVGDVAKAREFYEGLLGLEQAQRPEMGLAGVWYDLSGAQIHLIEAAPSGASIDPTGPHMAIELDELGPVRDALRQAGHPMLELGEELLWVLDPDGNTVELRTPRAFPR